MNDKQTKNLIDEETIQDRNLRILQEYFPQALERDPQDGKYIINSEKLQLALDPSKSKIEEDGYELKWVGKKYAYHNAFTKNDKLLKPLYDDSKD
jgi:adenine-specific DNA-methyltransferase